MMLILLIAVMIFYGLSTHGHEEDIMQFHLKPFGTMVWLLLFMDLTSNFSYLPNSNVHNYLNEMFQSNLVDLHILVAYLTGIFSKV